MRTVELRVPSTECTYAISRGRAIHEHIIIIIYTQS